MKLFLILSSLILLLLSIGIAYGIYYVAPYGIVLIDHFPRTQLAKLLGGKTTPESFGLKSEYLQVTAADSITLNGWFIPSQKSTNATIILLHGIRASKEQMLPAAHIFSMPVSILFYLIPGLMVKAEASIVLLVFMRKMIFQKLLINLNKKIQI
jgi:hypothetical protein